MSAARSMALVVASAVVGCGGDSTSDVHPPGTAIEQEGQAAWTPVESGDFNLDGMADVLWYDSGRNRMAVWLMSGVHLLQPGPEIPGPSGNGWTIDSASDFNHDGMADVLWCNSTTNRMAVWLMSGVHLLEPGPEIPGPSGTGWTCPTTGDFNDDGMTDVLWYNPTTKQMAIWLMAGTRPLAAGPEIPAPP